MTELIAGRYEPGQRIGSGGMAEVFRAHDHQLDRAVAIKILHRGYTSQPAFVERFRREAQSAASMDHPAIVPIYDWGPTADSYYIVMGYVDGQTLRDAYRDREKPETDEVLSVIAAVAAGLQHAHERGIVHRDIKPQNILIDSDGRPRITDFGIARAAGQTSLTETSVVLGTANYLSPEQATRKPIDARSDIYSLGIVTYEILAGRPPFQGESIVDLAMQHVHEDPPPLHAFRPDISPGVERVVMDCLAKDPDDRIQSAGQLQAELNRLRGNPAGAEPSATAPTVPVGAAAAATRPVADHAPLRGAREQSAGPRTTRHRSSPMVWAGIAIVGLAIVGVLALILTQLDGSDEPGTGIVDSNGGGQTSDGSQDDAPEDTDGVIDEGAAPSDTDGDPDGETAPEESNGEPDAEGPEAPANEQEDVPPENPPEDAPGQQENSESEEPPQDSGDQGNDQSAQQQSVAAEFPDDGVCDGAYESVSASQVLVPEGANCSLSGGRVDDEIVIRPGGTLQISDVDVMEDIQAEQAAGLDVGGGSYVDGNIQYSGGDAIRVTDTTVEGNLQFDANPGSIEILGNTVVGNVQLESNTGGVNVSNNQIDGNLECEENNPAPSGGGNNVAGDLEGQCASL